MLSKVLIVLTLLNTCYCSRILGVFPTPSISHQSIFQPIWKELALRGHQVTVITPDPLKQNITNLKEIDLHGAYEIFGKNDLTETFGKHLNIVEMLDRWQEYCDQVLEYQLENPQVSEIISGSDDQFDIILVEPLNSIVFGFAGKFKVPVVGVVSLEAPPNIYTAVGNPVHPLTLADVMINHSGEPTLIERLMFFGFHYFVMYRYQTKYLVSMDKIARKYFGNDMPYLGDLERNLSLLLVNVNPILNGIRPTVPAVVKISQMHIRAKKALPNDLEKFLNDSSEGVVYFSLGSNVKSSQLEPRVFQTIVDALGELPYKVLWKWETDSLPNQPKNVKISKWLPQQDVLGHPNIKVFVTQGGIQSVEESLSNGIPMVGIPFIGDQPANVRNLVEKGVAIQLDFNTMTKESLKGAILEIAENKKYKEKALELKFLLQDQPMTGLEKAVWWIEYVIRHKGAQHLSSKIKDVPTWKYYCLDCIAVYVTVPLVLVYILYKVLVLISIRIFWKKSNNKIKIN